jgi:hypothetical protein
MSMTGESIDKLYYSQNNLDNTYKQVTEEISRRTNKDISQNSNYRVSFNTMAKMVYEKTPNNERNLMNVNTRLIDKSVTYFHSKIFDKNVKHQTEKQINNDMKQNALQSNISTNHGFTMISDNKDLEAKLNQMVANRDSLGTGAGVRGDGNPNTYLPHPSAQANQFVKNERFVKGASNNNDYENQFLRMADNSNKQNNVNPNIDFTIKPFNLNEDLTDSLFGAENVDSPLYQNIENLQKMDSINPMSILDDFQRQRNQQIKNYSNLEKRENITAMKTTPITTNNIVFDRNNTDAITKIDQTLVDPMKLMMLGNELVDKYADKIEERIVNDDNVQTIDPMALEKMQARMITTQRETQPKYIEKVHYININSVDRLWETEAENRYNFKVRFNQNPDYKGAAISQLFRNIISVELVSAILPMDSSVLPFDNRLYLGIMRYPYLLLKIDELDSVFRGTNNWTDRAFSTLIFDKIYFTNVLSSDYAKSTESGGIVNSTPAIGFASEYLRGFMKFNPAYFEKKKFYNNPLASLNSMTIGITDPRGNVINTQDDVLVIESILFTDPLGYFDNNDNTNPAVIIDSNSLEITPTTSWPYASAGDYRMVQINTVTTFSNRLFRIGDRIIIRNFAFNNAHAGANDNAFLSFITRPEGHTIINLEIEMQGTTEFILNGNKGFISTMYIAPPGTFNTTTNTVNDYFDDDIDFGNVAEFGKLINLDLQSHLLFRIVTRDPDTSNLMQPINVY